MGKASSTDSGADSSPSHHMDLWPNVAFDPRRHGPRRSSESTTVLELFVSGMAPMTARVERRQHMDLGCGDCDCGDKCGGAKITSCQWRVWHGRCPC
jgi:hypothetical protein